MAKSHLDKLILIVVIILILLFVVGPIIFYYSTSFEKDITVKEKYTSQVYGKYGTSIPIYYVVANDDTTYKIVNMWWMFDFNDTDDYGKINIGKTYRVKGYGKRVPFLGMVHKIYDIGM